MSELPDFADMTKEEIGDWFLSNDTSALMSAAQPASATWSGVQVLGLLGRATVTVTCRCGSSVHADALPLLVNSGGYEKGRR
jgi:hypothetical protein